MSPRNPDDKPNFGHAVIGFFFWPIGLLAYLLLYDASPQRARSIGTGVALGMMLTFLGAFWLPFLLASGITRSYRSTSTYNSSLSQESKSTIADLSVATPDAVSESSIPSSDDTPVAPETSESTDEDKLRSRYSDWVKAWQDKDINSYVSFYLPEATIRDADGKPYSIDELKTRRTKRWQKERDIKIEDTDVPEINIVGDEATLTTHRNYHSNISNYSGTKTMTWRRNSSEWLIDSETFKMDSVSIE